MLGRARQQDSDAWRKLVQLYSPLVFHWCRQSGFDSHTSADLLQETFLAVHKALDRFEREQAGSFRGWLWTIARNKMRDAARKSPPVASGGSSAQAQWQDLAEPEPDEQSVSGERKHSLMHRAFDLIRVDFNDATWAAFQGVMIEGKPAREVAAELGLSTGAVYQARARVLSRLREELGDAVEFA